MKKYFTLICLLNLCLLAGCETMTPLHVVDKETRLRYLEMNPVNDEAIKKAMEKGRVIPGMTKDQVEAVWGEPAARGIGRWDYRGVRNIYIRFTDDVVKEVRFYTNL